MIIPESVARIVFPAVIAVGYIVLVTAEIVVERRNRNSPHTSVLLPTIPQECIDALRERDARESRTPARRVKNQNPRKKGA